MDDAPNEKLIEERVHQQLIYKDNRIIDLNNVILDKERQILDLQERVREQGEVASVKTQAMKIVQQKFEELNRERRDIATETDSGLLSLSIPSTSSGSTLKSERRARSSSPGHVIASRKIITGTFSPPPVDPPTEKGSKFGANLPDIDGIHHTKKNRKRVTFDLPPAARSGSTEELTSALTEASSENLFLRQKVEELNVSVEKMKEQYDAEILKYTKEAKTAGLKARVVATARIKELEGSLESLANRYNLDTDRLKEEVNTLRDSRDWEIEQNGNLREQVAQLKEKTHKLTVELDDSETNKRRLDKEAEQSKKLMELMADDLTQAENLINYHEAQKEAIFEDVDRLKEAIMAQDRFIEILEADIVIYEEHIGLLRESLGASKIDHRDLIKSKAFETKLLALEREKDLIDKKSNEDRLKTKALDKKCRVLVEQNEQLMSRLCELEMNSSEIEEYQRKMEEMREEVRQIQLALKAERDVSQKLRESKELFEKQLESITTSQRDSSSSNVEMDNLDEVRREAESKIEELTEELHLSRRKLEAAMGEVEQLRAANFDLQMNVQEANKESEKYQSTCDDLETQIRDIEERMENKTEELKQAIWDCEQLTKENESMRVEIESSRKGLEEAKRIENDVESLKEELVRQQELSKKQWEDAVRRMQVEEPVAGRKTSMEIQYEQYVIEFEKKIEILQSELKIAKENMEKEKTEKKKLKQAVKQLRDRKEQESQVQSNEELIVKTEEIGLQSAPNNLAEKDAEIEELKRKLNSVEIEAKLSAELNVELGRAMLELEEKNMLLNEKTEKTTEDGEAGKMELRLHQMLVEEMSGQIHDMQARIDEMSLERKEQMNKLEENLKAELNAAQAEASHSKSEMNRLLHNLAEFEIARKDDIEGLKKEHEQEVQRLSIQIEDYRREISDRECQLKISEDCCSQLKEQLKKSREQVDIPVDECQQETQILTCSSTQIGPVSERTSETNVVSCTLEDENMRLKECIDESSRIHSEVSRDMSKLIELKDELEVAVQALKAEIWTLNGQLKASILDREQMEDKVSQLECTVESEKKRAISLDVELQEQVDLTDKALRRAAEAENESNRRLAECLEMEERREEIEKAYTSLNEYYNQLQAAYNQVYAQLAASQQGEKVEVQIPTCSAVSSDHQKIDAVVGLVEKLLKLLKLVDKSSIETNIEVVLENISTLVKQVEDTKSALEEQKRINEALRERLETVEQEVGSSGTTRERVEQLEGEVEWKEEECEGLKRRIKELEGVLDVIAERADETEAATVSRLSMELAILAAKLTTRQADVNSLFRTNAELAHTNVRLQNEIDDYEVRVNKLDEERIEEKENLMKQISDLEEKVRKLEQSIDQKEQVVEEKLNNNEEEMKERIEHLQASEHLLRTNVATLESQVGDLQKRLDEAVSSSNQEESNEDGWGWGESKTEESESSEFEKEEISRLKEIERILNNRILSLEDQNLELEEKIQELSEELFEEKEKNKKEDDDEELTLRESNLKTCNEKEEEEEEWGWGQEDKEKNEECANSEVERLKTVETELLERVNYLESENQRMKEFLQIAENALLEEQNRNDELEQKLEENSSVKKNDNQESWGWDEEKPENCASEEKDELNRKIDELEKRALEEGEKKTELQRLLAEERKTIEELYDKESELRDRVDELEEILQEKSTFERTLRQDFAELKKQVEELTKELDEKKRVIENLESELLEKEQKNEADDGWNNDGWEDGESEEKKEELNKYVQELDMKNRDIEDMKKKEGEFLKRIAQLEQRLESMEEEFEVERDEIKKELEEVVIENCELKKRINETIREKEQLAEQVELLTKEKSEDNGWNEEWDDQEENAENVSETKRELEAEVEKRDQVIARLGEELSAMQDELLKATESCHSDEKAAEAEKELALKDSELENMRIKLKATLEQNNLLKDSEARLIDHADEYAQQMDNYKEQCVGMKKTIEELEKKLKNMAENSEESFKIKNQLTIVENDLLNKTRLITEKEARIIELTREIEKYSERIIELEEKLKKLEKTLLAQRQRRKVPSSSSVTASRPSSRLSTSSSVSYQPSSQFMAEPSSLQSAGSAFDVVVPQSSLEPVRRRNK